jgi:agmatine/peptidylarginine deiminase
MISDGLTLKVELEKPLDAELTSIRDTHLPAEWAPQSAVQLTWPHEGTDWAPILPMVTDCYVRMALEIALREPLIIVAQKPEEAQATLKQRLPAEALGNIRFYPMPTDDTWARDHGFITLLSPQGPLLLDFQFNGWGKKFEAAQDNRINRTLMKQQAFRGTYIDHLDFVLEGGSIESDGRGTILTTSQCLLAPNRNQPLSQTDIENRLKEYFHAQRVLWLNHGYLEGDDTDSHVDTLARLCPNDTIAYVQCTQTDDPHYEELRLMEEELKQMRTPEGEPFTLVPLPMAAPAYDDEGQRLPDTYANFLVINGAVLMPTYNHPELDEQAQRQLQKAFPKHEIVGIDCRALIIQHGSLHCCTMQFPLGAVPQPQSPTPTQEES